MTLYGKVEIKDLDNNTYTLGSENRGYEVRLDKRKADVFKLQVADPQDGFKDKYVEGGEVTVYCDPNNQPTTKIFNGIIEDVSRKDILGTRVLNIQATEKFFVRAMGALVTERFSDKAAGWIAKTLIDNYTSGFTTTNVQNTDTTVQGPETFNRDPLKKCLDRLAEIAGAIWYCTAAGDVYFHPKETVESGLALTESMVKPVPVIRKNIQDLYTVITVQGGVSLDLDQSQQTATGGPVSLYDRDVAVKFTPTKIYGKNIELYFDKLGSPDADLSGHIADDDSNSPGEARTFFTVSKDQFDAAGWHGVKIEVEVDPSKSYWIVVNRGGDASNCYRWYHDGGTTGSHGEKTNGSWTIVSNSWIPAFKQYGGNPILARAVNPVTYSDYGRRELIVKRPEVTDKADAVKIASQVLLEKGVVKTEFSGLNVNGEDLTSLPQTGELADLTVSQLNFDDKVVVEKILIKFPAGSETVPNVVFTVGEPIQGLADRIAGTEEGLEEEKRKELANQERLDLIELFQESLPLSDILSTQEPGDAQHPAFPESFSLSDALDSTIHVGGWTCGDADATCGFVACYS